MINYEIANLKELFEELKKTKEQLVERLELIEKTYQETKKKVKKNNKALNLLRCYYESDSVNMVLTNSADILKIIDNIIADNIVHQAYINQLKSVAKTNRIKGLGDFKEDWLKKFHNEDYSDIYKQSCYIDDWISDCINIAYCLNDFIGEKNPLNDNKEETVIQKIEITKMPELQVKNIEDIPIIKGKKRIHLPKFQPTDWAKITIRFLDERNVLITADKKENITADYEALGFKDEKRDKPNTAWAFLYELAKTDGTTSELPKPIPDKIKQHKKHLSDSLKHIFKNDTDPFYDPTTSKVYMIKINLIPPIFTNEKSDKYGIQEYLKEKAIEE